MRVVAVLRKPLEGTVAQNCLEHGCGAINVDGCRIAGIDPANAKRLGRNYTHEDTNFGDAKFGQKTQAVVGGNLAGRWPSNVILQHRPGCKQDGIKKVKGIGGGALSGDNAFGQDAGWNAHQNRPTNITRQMDKDGKETIANWTCAEGCPVAELDEQSGVSFSSGGRTANISATSTIYGGGKGLGQDINPDLVRGDPGYGDTGGASRFFKQVKE